LTEALEEETVARPRGEGRTRMCAVTREVLPEAALIRFVASPDGDVVPDLKAKLPGRGIWVGASRTLVAEAVRRNVFARGLKRTVRPASDLPERVAARLKEAALGRLGIARKAGAVAAGFAKTEAAIAGKRLAALLIAAEAAEDGRRKMLAALRRSGAAVPVPVFRIFGGAELGLAIGRADVIHAAVLQSPTGASFVEAALRLQRYDGVAADQREAGCGALGSDE
jgi:predicted RNA-binding protein YlxR (DUF448 family)/ribosomal protein L30E